MKLMILLGLCLSLFACTDGTKDDCGASELYSSYWNWQLETFPSKAASENHGDRFTDLFIPTEENLKKVNDSQAQFLAKAKNFQKKSSCKAESTNLSLMILELEESLEAYKYSEYVFNFSSNGGPQTWTPQMYKHVPLKTVQNYKDLVIKMGKIPEYFDALIANSKTGIKKGLVPPKAIFKDYRSSFSGVADSKGEKNPFYEAFVKFPTDISDKDQAEIRKLALEAIQTKVRPAYQKLSDFWAKEYEPSLRDTLAATQLPNGVNYYNFRIKTMTTLDKTAEEIHEIGLGEVKRILSEMNKIKDKVKFKGDLKAFFKHLRTSPKFYAKSAEELMHKTAFILKTMDGKMPKLFKVMPQLPYGIEPIPDLIAHKAPAAYYMGGNIKIGKAGTYQLNVSSVKSRPLYNLTALSLHEAVPGHHLQVALAQEIKGTPEFRKDSRFTAFVEGWGLYAESLGLLVGMYDDPYDDFGRLNYEQWRAMRLVVDTGIHAKAWSRQQAIDYMKANSGLSEKNIISEVDRYIGWPGQALAYKMGELKLQELRRLSQKELGDKFDIRDYHYEVHKDGAVPLPVLENNIKAYIKKTKGA